MISFLKRYIWPLLAASLATTLLASIISSQRVANALGSIGAKTSFSDRLSMTIYDAQHFGSIYGIFIFIALLIALTTALLIGRKKTSLQLPLFMGAGFTAMLVMLLIMKQVFFGVPIVGGARDLLGFLLQGLTGALGGWVFYKLRKPKAASQYLQK